MFGRLPDPDDSAVTNLVIIAAIFVAWFLIASLS